MNCALCKGKLHHLSVTCFDSIHGGHFNICFDCANEYFKNNPDKSLNDIALKITIDLEAGRGTA